MSIKSKQPYKAGQITRECDTIGKSLEEELREATASKKPIEMTTELIFTNQKDGVLPQYDVRTDKQEIAIDIANKHEASEAMRGDLNDTEDNEENKPEEETKVETEKQE